MKLKVFAICGEKESPPVLRRETWIKTRSWEVGEESDHSGTPVLLYSLGKNNLEVASFV